MPTGPEARAARAISGRRSQPRLLMSGVRHETRHVSVDSRDRTVRTQDSEAGPACDNAIRRSPPSPPQAKLTIRLGLSREGRILICRSGYQGEWLFGFETRCTHSAPEGKTLLPAKALTGSTLLETIPGSLPKLAMSPTIISSTTRLHRSALAYSVTS